MTQSKSQKNEKQRAESPWFVAWKKFRKSVSGMIGMVTLIVLVFAAIFANVISPTDPNLQILEYSVKQSMFRGNILLRINQSRPDEPIPIAISVYKILGEEVEYVDAFGATKKISVKNLQGKTEDEWHKQPLFILGTDLYGRDVLSRILHGARVSLSIGIISEGISLLIGIFLGALAGYYRGWVDAAIMWLTNVVWSFPTILLVIAFSVALGQGFWQTFVAIGVSSWVDITRIVRGQFFSLREAEFVEAARSLGFKTPRIIFRHILPNVIGPITVISTAGFASAIVSEAGLSFLGLGIQPPTASWGQMIRTGYSYIAVGNWGLAMYPCIILAAAVVAINLLGDGMRDALDPRTLK